MKKYLAFFLISIFLSSLSIFACGENKKGCPLEGKEILKEEEGTVKGKVLCKHCDLHKSEKCQKVILTSDEKIFEICPDCLKEIKIEDFKKKEVEAKGKIKYTKDGIAVICIKEIKNL